MARPKLPDWIRVRVGSGESAHVGEILHDLKLNTVCAGAQCPNLGECFCKGTATFLIMGRSCTRDCKFCAIPHDSHPALPEENEAQRLAEAAVRLHLRYVVITSVTRDDLPDGGASCFARVIQELHRQLPEAGVEVLTPDFNCDLQAISTVLAARPSVFNHNIETVERLSCEIRTRATYHKTLEVLRLAHKNGNGIPVKSGLMVGLGERDDEIDTTLRDLRSAGVSIVTIGQYLPPSADHWPLDRYVTPERFLEIGEFARSLGFESVASAPLVRSSYQAESLFRK